MKKNQVVVSVMGSSGVGKSALSTRFLSDEFTVDHDPTVSDYYQSKIDIDSKSIGIQIIDTAGQDDFKSLWNQWMQESDGFVLCYDITDKDSLNYLTDICQTIWRNKEYELNQESMNPRFPIVIVGCKCDLEEKRELTKNEGKKVVESLIFMNTPETEVIPYFLESSSKENINVKESFESVVRMVLQKRESEKLKFEKKKKSGGGGSGLGKKFTLFSSFSESDNDINELRSVKKILEEENKK
eukprot:gene4789-8375_t